MMARLDYEFMADALDEAWDGVYSAIEALEGSGTTVENDWLSELVTIKDEIYAELEAYRAELQNELKRDEDSTTATFVRKELDAQ